MPNNGTAVDCFDYNHQFVKRFRTLSDAYAEIGAHPSNIRRAARQGTICAKHYWKIATLQRKQSTEPLRVWQWLHDGTFCAEYSSCMEASRMTGAPANNIARAAKNMHYSCGGYRWTFAGTKLVVEPNPRVYNNSRPNVSTSQPVAVIPIKRGGGYLESDVEIFPSITSATNSLSLKPSCRSEVTKSMKGIRYCAVGYYWLYPDDPAKLIAEVERRERERANGIAYRTRRGHESLDALFDR